MSFSRILKIALAAEVLIHFATNSRRNELGQDDGRGRQYAASLWNQITSETNDKIWLHLVNI